MPWFIPQCSLTHWNAPNIRAKTILFNYHNKQNKTNKHKNVSPEENERLHSTMFWLKLNNSIWPQLFTRWYVPIVCINNTPARTSPLLIAFGLALITATAAGERESWWSVMVISFMRMISKSFYLCPLLLIVFSKKLYWSRMRKFAVYGAISLYLKLCIACIAFAKVKCSPVAKSHAKL